MPDEQPPDTGPTGPVAPETHRRTARSRVVVASTVAVSIAVLATVWWALGDAGSPTPVTAEVAAPSTTGQPATTTAIVVPDVDRWESAIASVVGSTIEVRSDPPAELTDPDQRLGHLIREQRQANAAWAAYSPAPADQPEIPSLAQPVEGRVRTDTGWVFSNPSGWGDTLTFSVLEDHGDWLKVAVPARPNGAEGWIRRSEVITSTTRFHIRIDVGSRTLTVFDGDAEVLSTPVVVGKASTPTPTGRFFVTDHVEKHSGSAYGPWILPLSGFSQALDEFAGGAPVIAIHGTNQPDLAGTASSNGCIRIPSDEVVNRLRAELPLGTPVDIV